MDIVERIDLMLDEGKFKSYAERQVMMRKMKAGKITSPEWELQRAKIHLASGSWELDKDGKVKCPVCDGKGKDYSGRKCIHCDGTGRIKDWRE